MACYERALTPGRVLEHFLADPPPEGDEAVGTSESPGAPGQVTADPVSDLGSFEYEQSGSSVGTKPEKKSGSDRAKARRAKLRRAKVRKAKARKAKVRKCRSLNRKKARRACLRRI